MDSAEVNCYQSLILELSELSQHLFCFAKKLSFFFCSLLPRALSVYVPHFLQAYRKFCIAPPPEGRGVFEILRKKEKSC
jgi:hypothetical protein